MFQTPPSKISCLDLTLPKTILEFWKECQSDGEQRYLRGNLKLPNNVKGADVGHGDAGFREAGESLSETEIPGPSECFLRLETPKAEKDMLRLTIDGLNLHCINNRLTCFVKDLYSADICSHGFDELHDEDKFDSEPSLSSISPMFEDHSTYQSETPVLDHSVDLEKSITDDVDKVQQIELNTKTIITLQRKKGRPRKKKSRDYDKNSFVKHSTAGLSANTTASFPSGRYNLRGAKIKKELLAAEMGYSEDEVSDNAEGLNEKGDNFNKLVPKTIDSLLNGVNPTTEMDCEQNCEVIGDNMPGPNIRRKRNNHKIAECKICGKLFCDFTGVDEHVRKFHESHANFDNYIIELETLKLVKCLKCDLTCKNRYALQVHEDTAHCKFSGSKCHLCHKEYKSLRSLKLHMKFVHSKCDQEHLCHLCPAKFKWNTTLRQHIQEIHSEEKAFSCTECGKLFSRKGQLNRHMKIHATDVSKKLLCNVCGKGFWYETNLQRHIKSIHQIQSEKFHCSYCGKGFTQKGSMVAHVRLIHFKLYPFACKLCDSSFARSKYIEDHMRSAHGDKDFKVEETQRQRYKYNRTADDLFYCTYCSKSFYYKAKMVEHIHSAHAKDFPFVCTICDQGFLLQSYLRKHQKAAHRQMAPTTAEGEENEVELSENNLLRRTDFEQNQITENLVGLEECAPNITCTDPSMVMEQSVNFDDIDLMDSDAAAASLLVEVASGSLGSHYILRSHEQTSLHDAMNVEIQEPQSVVEIITSEQRDTHIDISNQISNLNNCETPSLPATETVSVLPEYVEDTVVLTDNLQFHDGVATDIPLSVVVIESETLIGNQT